MSSSHSPVRELLFRDGTYPLSSIQHEIWIDQQLNPGLPLYNLGAVFRMAGTVVADLLEQAIDLVANAHDALRIGIRADLNGPRQHVIDRVRVPLQVRDLSAETGAEAAAQVLIRAHCSQAFPTLEGPMWDNLLIRVSADRHYWVHRQHHLGCDGASIAMLARAVETAYNALLNGEVPQVTPGVSCLEYLQEDLDYRESKRFETDRQFWVERFPRLPAPLFDRKAGDRASVTSGRLRWTLPKTLYEQLATTARGHGATVVHAFLAAIALYFARTRGLDEVAIGVPVHNRSARHKNTLGMFAKVLPIGVRVEREQTFAELMGAVAGELRRGYRHQRFPLSEIERRLQSSLAGRRQLFDLTFSYEEFFHGFRFGDAHATPLHIDHGHEQLPLAISVTVAGAEDGVEVEFDHCHSVLSTQDVELLRNRLLGLLQAAVQDPQRAVGELPLLSREDEHWLDAVAFGDIVDHVPTLAHREFEARTAEAPDAVAYVDEIAETTYSQLNERANRIAHWLLTRGIGPDDRVAVCLPRGVDLIAALLGVLKAGAAYVPLDPEYPAERLAYMLEDSRPRALLRHRHGAVLEPGQRPEAVLWLDQDEEVRALPTGNPQLVDLRPEHLAYVIYTSGSTGRPKGVQIEHRNLAHQIAVHRGICNLGPTDRMLQFASASFDSAVVEIFPTLSAGAALVHRPHWLHAPDQQFVAFLDANRVTVLDLPTAFWAAWTHALSSDQCVPGPDLRAVVVGGENVEPRHWAAWRAHPRTRACRWINTYGPTETTVYSTAWLGESDAPMEQVSIGRPVPNTEIRLFDPAGQPVPPGVAGEIWIAGAGVARGYLAREELTAQTFITRVGRGGTSRRYYRTGDLACWNGAGRLSFLGRNDHQVKIRGHRIEPGEIEARLAELASVQEAVVLAQDDELGQAELVAYVVPASGAQPSPSELRDQLAGSLAPHMLPAQYVVLPAVPLTPNGKVDRKALPRPDESARAVRAFQSPQGEAELALAAIWCELFGLDRVGRGDHFFELGGHSLRVVELIERLRRIGFETDVRSVFDAPQLSALAARLKLRDANEAEAAAVSAALIPAGCDAITPQMVPLLALEQGHLDAIVAQVPGGARNVQDIYPLVALQEGMLFHHLLEQEGDAYLMQSVLAFDGRSELDAFLAALQQVVDRHDILRSAMHWHGLPAPVQVVQRSARLPVHECTLLPDQDPVQQLRSIADPGRTRLDLRQAPLMAVWVAQEPGSQRWLLALLDHHIVCDHVTLELILDEVRQLLRGEQGQLPAPLPFRTYVAEARTKPEADHARYFRRQLGDVHEPTVPFGLHQVRRDGSDVEEARLPLPGALSEAIRACACRYKVSPAVFFHLAWARLVAATAAADDVVFGTVLSGRLQDREGVGRALGMFLNTLPLRLPLGDRAVVTALLETRDRLTELLQHEQASLALAQRLSGVPIGAPLFSSLFNFRHSTLVRHEDCDEVDMAQLDGLRVLSVEERTNYPLGVSVDDHGRAFALTVQCLKTIGARRMVLDLEAVIRALLQALESNPQLPVMELPVLSEWERQQLARFNATRQTLSGPLTVHGRFQAQAKRTPAAPAVAYGERQLSYGELDAQADRLAARLRSHCVNEQDLVALFLPRGIDMVVALLAVWKAGAAYVPLDPSYPLDRLKYMVGDSAPCAILAHRDGLPPGLAEGIPVLWIDAETDAPLVNETAAPAESCADPGKALAYVIYTSGSTGHPKGVMVEHAGVCNLAQAMAERFAVGPGERVLQFASLSFDASVAEIAMTLCSGACLHLADRSELMPGEPLLATLRERAITNVTLPSSALAACGERAAESLPPLTIIAAGDALPGVLARQWARHHRLFNAYGPTEASVCTSVHACSAVESERVPIGRPIANVQVHVLDRRGHAVPVGAIGEICIGGAGVARGYLGRADLTAERFVIDPRGMRGHGRMYRTGDLGSWRADGELEFLGRNDHQVKIRGFRIEPGEIEAWLRQLPDVEQAAVIVREDVAGDRRLVAYLVPHSGRTCSIDAMRDALTRQLPEHMVPAAFVVLPELPLSANGKLDRAALPAPNRDAATQRTYAAPVGEVEQELCALWQTLLRVERVGRDDHFFELGGHSLLAVTLVSHLRERFGVEIALKQVFDQPRLFELAAMVTAAQLDQFSKTDLAAFADELDGLSEDELMALLMEGNEA